MGMKFLTSFFAISIMAVGIADATAPSRSRPGSISGAVMSRNAPVPAAMPVVVPAVSSIRYSPITNNALKEVILQNGGLTYVDTSTDDIFVYDADGNLKKVPVDPDDEIVTALGISVGAARRACRSITADGYMGEFDETTYTCLIPVVAHNWSGVIKKDKMDVMAYAPMGNMFKCSADAFENVKALRRTSQWVIPVMVVGSAGIGAGIGAIVDKVERDKAAEKAKDEKEKLEKLRDDLKADLDLQNEASLAAGIKGTVNVSGTVPADNITLKYDGIIYDLLNKDDKVSEADKAKGIRGYDILANKLKTDVNTSTDNINGYLKAVNKYMRVSFREMVSSYTCTGMKLGRIKITKDLSCAGEGGGDVSKRIYCWYDSEHVKTDPIGDCFISNASDDYKRGRSLGSTLIFTPQRVFNAATQCYFREEITALRGDARLYKYNNSTQFAKLYDTTAGADLERWNMIDRFKRELCDAKDFESYVKPNGKWIDACQFATDVINGFNTPESENINVPQKIGNTNEGNSMKRLVLKSKGTATAGSVLGQGFNGNDLDCEPCKEMKDNKLVDCSKGKFPSLARDSMSRFYEQYYAASALAAAKPNGKPIEGLNDFDNIVAAASANYNRTVTLNAFADFLTEMQGNIDARFAEYFKDKEKEKKPFLQTGTGRGLLIGSGVGALAGLGYWFAEGASVFCNVGGMEQVKLNKTYSIPTFREYIIQKGYLK